MTHTLSASGVELLAPSLESFIHRDIAVDIDARILDDRAFATITCTGRCDVPPGALAAAPGVPQFVADGVAREEHQGAVNYGWAAIEPVLIEVAGVLRWRFGMFGADEPWTSTHVFVQVDDQTIEFHPMGQASLGHDRTRLDQGGLSHIAALVEASLTQPLAHELWREAWNLQYSRPRSSLVLGVAAAEVGFKHLVALLVPHAESLVEHVPSPPLDVMIRKVLPDLPVRSAISPLLLCPRRIRHQLVEAVEARNKVVHRGATPTLSLWTTLQAVREFLYLLDLHAGHAWSESFLADDTRAALRQ